MFPQTFAVYLALNTGLPPYNSPIFGIRLTEMLLGEYSLSKPKLQMLTK